MLTNQFYRTQKNRMKGDGISSQGGSLMSDKFLNLCEAQLPSLQNENNYLWFYFVRAAMWQGKCMWKPQFVWELYGILLDFKCLEGRKTTFLNSLSWMLITVHDLYLVSNKASLWTNHLFLLYPPGTGDSPPSIHETTYRIRKWTWMTLGILYLMDLVNDIGLSYT